MNLDDRARRAAGQLIAEVNRRPLAHAAAPAPSRAGRVAVAACCVLAVSAVGVLVARGSDQDGTRSVTAADRPPPTTDAPGPGDVPAGWARCTDAGQRYSVGYPAEWHTAPEPPPEAKAEGIGVGPCQFFNPERFEIHYWSEWPTTALIVSTNDGAYDERSKNVEDPHDHERVLLWESTTVQGRRAVRVERVSTGKGLYGEGLRYYGWIIDRQGQAFTVGGFWSPQSTLSDSERKAVIDQAVETLRFLR